MAEYGVQAQTFGTGIWVGRVNRRSNQFTDKIEGAGMVFQAVAEWCEQNHDGSAWVVVDGMRMDITVTRQVSS